MKFESAFGIIALLTLCGSLFYFSNNLDVVNQIILVLTNIVTSIATFFFTKFQVGDK